MKATKSGKVQKAKEAPAVIEQGHEVTNSTQPEELRAFVPAGAAVAETEVDEDFADDYDGDGSEDNDLGAPTSLWNGKEQDAAIDEGFIEETIEQVNSMHRGQVDNGKLEIGEYLLDRVFKGDIAQAISRNPYKEATFARIAKDPRLAVQGKTLGGWVRAAALRRDFNDQGFDFKNLTTYHYIELATVKDAALRTKYARLAEIKDQSVQELKEVIRANRATTKSDAEKMVVELEKVIRFSGQLPETNGLVDFATDLSLVQEHYTDQKAVAIRGKVRKALANVEAYKNILSGFLTNLRVIINEGEVDQPQN
jgi:hypothetical protein